jgi:hypothetical protein
VALRADSFEDQFPGMWITGSDAEFIAHAGDEFLPRGISITPY